MSKNLKQAKFDHKRAVKNKAIYVEQRNGLVNQILKTEAPNWDSLQIKLIEW